MMPMDIGISGSTSASSGNQVKLGDGDWVVTGGGGGGLGSILPNVPADKAWLVWVIVAVTVLAGLFLWRRKR